MTVTVSNVSGQVVMQRDFTGEKIQMDITHLPTGVYFLQLKSGKNVEEGKIIKY
jgi:hypothetical protein